MQYAAEVEQQARAQNDSLMLAEAWYLYGKTHVFAGDYQTAQAYFMKSLRIQEPRGDSPELSRLYVRLSENEERLGHSAESLRIAWRAMTIAQRIKSDKALLRAYGALARAYEGIWDGKLTGDRRAYDQIHTLYKKREALAYQLNDTLGKAEVSMQIGTLYTRTKNRQAIPYLEKALALYSLLNEYGVSVNAMVHLATAYSMSGKPKLAFKMLRNAEQLYQIRNQDEYDTRLLLEKNYVDYFRSVGQWKAAFDHLEKVNLLERTQLLADNNGAITRLNIEYQTEKNEAQLMAQKRDLALRSETLRSQQRLTVAISFLLIMAIGMSFLFFQLSRKNQRISRRNLELVKEQNHRVKNNLQVVSSLLSLQSKRLTDEVAKKAVEESRLRVQSMAILHRRLYDGDKLAEANLQSFISEVVNEVLKAYGWAGVETCFLIDDISLAADKAVPLGLIINELTTNACKYAFPGVDNPRYLISCRRNKRVIELKIADNGPGLDGPGLDGPGLDGEGLVESEDNSGSGFLSAVVPVSFGMQLIQAQVEQLSGTYRFVAGEGQLLSGVVFTMEFKG